MKYKDIYFQVNLLWKSCGIFFKVSLFFLRGGRLYFFLSLQEKKYVSLVFLFSNQVIF